MSAVNVVEPDGHEAIQPGGKLHSGAIMRL